MNLGNLKQRFKLQVPNINQIGLTDSYLTELLNKGVEQANLYARVYFDYTDFNSVAEQMEYLLSDVAPTYAGAHKNGLYYKTSDGEWHDIIPKTKGWITETYPNFLNNSSASLPQWYWIEGNELGLYPKPSDSRDNAIRLYHLKQPTDMVNDDDFPFTGNSTEITTFRALDDAIIAHARWKASPAFGQVTDQDLRKREFLEECKSAAGQIKRRPDIGNERQGKMNVVV